MRAALCEPGKPVNHTLKDVGGDHSADLARVAGNFN
jgi:hypothetical protein